MSEPRPTTTVPISLMLAVTLLTGAVGILGYLVSDSIIVMLVAGLVSQSLILPLRRLRAKRLLASGRRAEVFTDLPHHSQLVLRLCHVFIALPLVGLLAKLGLQGEGWLIPEMGPNWWLALVLGLPLASEADARIAIARARSAKHSLTECFDKEIEPERD